MRRPPYLRWLAAGVVLLVGLMFETRTPPTVLYPYADTPIAAGTPIDDTIAWKEIPKGILPEWSTDVGGIAQTGFAANDPILPSQIGDLLIPADWWAVALVLPAPVAAGTPHPGRADRRYDPRRNRTRRDKRHGIRNSGDRCLCAFSCTARCPGCRK